MGYIKLEYSCSINTDVKAVLNEIEYGNTFIINYEGERTISLFGKEFSWIKSDTLADNRFDLYVDDTFFEEGTFFEKLMTSFIYNLQDFGEVRLDQIDSSNSILEFSSPIIDAKKIFKTFPVCGTIFKPYYHSSLNEKLNVASKLVSMGINLIKDDETYLIGKKQKLSDAKKIQSVMGSDAFYIPNITPFVHDMQFLTKLLDTGIKIVMVNYLVTGFSQIRWLKQNFPQFTIWGHRVGYSSLENILTMNALSKIALFSGIDYLHLGTTLQKDKLDEQNNLIKNIRKFNSGFMPIFTKTSSEILPLLFSKLSKEIIVLACGYFRDERTSEINWKQVNKWITTAKNES